MNATISPSRQVRRDTSDANGGLPDDLVLELLHGGQSASSFSSGAFAAAQKLAHWLGDVQIVLGWKEFSGDCRVVADTLQSRSSQRTLESQDDEAALNEAALWRKTLVCHSDGESDEMAKALQQRLAKKSAHWGIAAPLQTPGGELLGACLIFGSTSDVEKNVRRRFEAALPILSVALQSAALVHQSMVSRLLGKARSVFSGKSRRVWGYALAGIVLLGLLPIPRHIGCTCVLEPSVKRYVATPFDSLLASTHVAPGDLVTKGMLLAELDGHEVHLEIDSVESERAQIAKQADTALAQRETARHQLLTLEMQKLENRLELLRDRAQHLQITSPTDGMVLAGDLKRSIGVPLERGQALFEIAPLDQVLIEIEIPEEEIDVVEVAQEVDISLNSHFFSGETVCIERIRPVAELREDRVVFIGEGTLENTEDHLRPGMQGDASVRVGWQVLGQAVLRAIDRWSPW